MAAVTAVRFEFSFVFEGWGGDDARVFEKFDVAKVISSS